MNNYYKYLLSLIFSFIFFINCTDNNKKEDYKALVVENRNQKIQIDTLNKLWAIEREAKINLLEENFELFTKYHEPHILKKPLEGQINRVKGKINNRKKGIWTIHSSILRFDHEMPNATLKDILDSLPGYIPSKYIPSFKLIRVSYDTVYVKVTDNDYDLRPMMRAHGVEDIRAMIIFSITSYPGINFVSFVFDNDHFSDIITLCRVDFLEYLFK